MNIKETNSMNYLDYINELKINKQSFEIINIHGNNIVITFLKRSNHCILIKKFFPKINN